MDPETFEAMMNSGGSLESDHYLPQDEESSIRSYNEFCDAADLLEKQWFRLDPAVRAMVLTVIRDGERELKDNERESKEADSASTELAPTVEAKD
jgi:hypothetical protein